MTDRFVDAAELLRARREQDRQLIAKLEESLLVHSDNPAFLETQGAAGFVLPGSVGAPLFKDQYREKGWKP